MSDATRTREQWRKMRPETVVAGSEAQVKLTENIDELRLRIQESHEQLMRLEAERQRNRRFFARIRRWFPWFPMTFPPEAGVD